MQELEPQPFTIQGQPAFTFTALPSVGRPAPEFHLTDQSFQDWTLAHFAKKKKVLNIVPSLDLPLSRLSAEKFHAAVAARDDTVVLTISSDLPFALARFSGKLPTLNGKLLSTFRSPEFGMNYGTLIVEHALMGLQARAVIVLDEHDVVRYAQLVPELRQEPDYAAALAALGATGA